jgi:nicotinamidase/pyrazinamidase
MKRAFFDIDAQIDFVLPTGALYVPGAEKIIPAIAALNRYAVGQGIPLISTVCAHAEDDPEFRIWGPHCVSGTVGQQKPAATLVGQTILEKSELDLFRSSRLPGLLEHLAADAYVVYGVVTEVCVKFAAEGLLRTGTPVTIVTDAIQAFDTAAGDLFLRDFAASGGKLARLAEIRE